MGANPTRRPLQPEATGATVFRTHGQRPLSKDALQHLDAAYVAHAEEDVALQLSRAGVRLAAVLNKALGRQVAAP